MWKLTRRLKVAMKYGVPRSWRRLCVFVAAGLSLTTLFIVNRGPKSSTVPVKFLQRPIFASEKDISTDDYNTDYLTHANASFSKLVVYTKKGQGRTYELGEEIRVKIRLYDGYKRAIRRGGDLVRLWLRDIPQSACSAGHVIDNNDGTYSGVLKVDWVGNPEIIAGIAGPRETIKIMYKVFEEYKTLKSINAIFLINEGEIQVEETPCLPSPDVPGYSRVCNFTAENYGLPWYCGHPEIHGLTCFDWQHIIVRNNSGDLPLTEEESFIFSRKNLHTQLRPYQIQVKESERNEDLFTQPDTTVSCNQRPAVDTWGDVTPVGFFLQWVWVPYHCTYTVENENNYNTCLRDRRLLIYGDSTTRQWFVHLRKVMNLTMETEYFEDSQPWHKPCLAANPTYNYSVFWGPHEMPFYGGPQKGFNRPTYVYLDEIPSSSRDIVVIHYYLHFVSFHPSVFIRHIRRVYQSVTSLLSRAPNVTVVVKGPHAMTDMSGRIDDYWGPVYDNIIRNTFRPVMDKVFYLDFWDMTVASESESIHPNDTIISNMVHYMMNTACRKVSI